jgi:hypothetical protein
VTVSPDSTLEDFKPEWQFFAAFGAIGIVSLAVALDATSFFVALPVRHLNSYFILKNLTL